jgi:hypothetical protein
VPRQEDLGCEVRAITTRVSVHQLVSRAPLIASGVDLIAKVVKNGASGVLAIGPVLNREHRAVTPGPILVLVLAVVIGNGALLQREAVPPVALAAPVNSIAAERAAVGLKDLRSTGSRNAVAARVVGREVLDRD